MTLRKASARSAVLVVCISILATLIQARAQESTLGSVDFPTSGSPAAQKAFIRGLAALHSFWFEEALDAFRESTRIEPGFVMGYWGEAMAHNHPLWAQQDTEAARKVLLKIKDTAGVTARERAYVDAVRVLYGEGDKLARDIAYSEAMAKVRRDYPGDAEASCFYALSLLGTVRPGDKGFRRQMLAGSIALDIYRQSPNHPGAAHYIIHAFDDPEHAILALPAARRYAEIAPEAHHARHMPAHIFLQLGMWPEAAASNESAWAASDAWVKRKNLSIGLRDYHSLHWLTYVYLQQGRYGKAAELLDVMNKSIAEAGAPNLKRSLEMMNAAYIVETEKWPLAATLFGGPETGSQVESPDHMHGGSPYAGVPTAIFVRGLADPAFRETSIQRLEAARKQAVDAGEAYRAKQIQIMALEVSALAASQKSDFDQSIKLLKRATEIEEELSPPSGPPDLIKPSHELLGEVLLKAGRYKEAASAFATCLVRQPGRTRSLIGAARAAAKMNNSKGASENYSAFLHVWENADAGSLEVAEAKTFLHTMRP